LDHRIDITLRGSPTAITQIVNVTAPQRGGLNWAQAALMLNPDPDGWFHNWLCTLTLKTTKGNDRLAVVRCWDSLNEWTSTYITAMRRMNRRPLLSAAFCGGALTEAVRVTSGNSHFNVLFSVLSFIYNHWYNIPDVQLITIIQILTSPERLHGLFFHWCFAVRRLYHHFLVYIVGALQNAVDTLTNQAQKIASEAAEAEAMLDSDITTEDPEPPRGGLSKFFACFSKCYDGDNDDAAHGQRGHRRGLSRDRSSRTEISLCRVTTPLYSNILDNGLTKVGPLATLVVFVDEEMNEPRSDDALLDFYQTDVSKLVVDVEERVKALVEIAHPDHLEEIDKSYFELL
jgi:hypothetical protein